MKTKGEEMEWDQKDGMRWRGERVREREREEEEEARGS